MKQLSDITVVILGGGMGTRLRSVVADRPKVLARVRGKYFLTYIVDYLIALDIRHVVLCTGYLGDQIKAGFGAAYGPISLVYSQEKFPLGTGGALRLALPFFRSDVVLVMNGDSVCYADLRAFWEWHRKQGADASLVLISVPDVRRFGQVETDKEGRVLCFQEKNNGSGQGWISAGIYLINRKLIRDLPEGTPVSLEKEVFPSWIGKKFYGFKSEARFIDIGTPESYAQAEHFFGKIR